MYYNEALPSLMQPPLNLPRSSMGCESSVPLITDSLPLYPGPAEQVVRGDGAAAGQGEERAEGRRGEEGEEVAARVWDPDTDEGCSNAGMKQNNLAYWKIVKLWGNEEIIIIWDDIFINSLNIKLG